MRQCDDTSRIMGPPFAFWYAPAMLHRVMLQVADLERAAHFYQDILGLDALGPDLWPDEGNTLTFAPDESGNGAADAADQYVVLVQVPSPKPVWPGWCLYLATSPERWRDVHERLVDEGYQEIVDPRGGLRGAGELRARVRDPDGHAVEVHAFEPSFYDVTAAGRGKIVAGPIESFAVGSVRRFAEGRFYLVRLAEGFLAVSEVCTHRQFTVVYQPEHCRFYCPLHGNRYSRTGALIHKGAREQTPPLHVYPIELVDGIVVVDTDHSVPRTPEEADVLVPLPATANPLSVARDADRSSI